MDEDEKIHAAYEKDQTELLSQILRPSASALRPSASATFGVQQQSLCL